MIEELKSIIEEIRMYKLAPIEDDYDEGFNAGMEKCIFILNNKLSWLEYEARTNQASS